MLSANQILHKGRYRVINPFRSGGMYEAFDTVGNANVVLKETLATAGKVATSSQLEAADAAFSNSAKVLTKFQHNALVSVRDYFSEVERQYLVLEPLSESDLSQFFTPGAARPNLDQALDWTWRLLDALHYLHKLSPPVVHGNIRPENIRFTASNELKLLTAEIETIPATNVSRTGPNPTNGGNAINYQPLEQFWSRLDPASQRSLLRNYDERAERILQDRPDARSDVYSVGACLYHLLTGVVPVDALDRAAAVAEGKPDPLKKPSEIDGDIPVEVSDLTMKALEVRREARFYSAAVMAQVVKTVRTLIAGENASPSGGKAAKGAESKTVEPVTNDPVNTRLERERSKTEARQRELEAEQARLEDDLKRIEERRIALEAEKQNQIAEIERLELEAETERKKAEQERRLQEKRRLEAEAEQERESAAKRLAEIEAAELTRRAEAERLALEAEETRKRAEETLAQLQAEQERHRIEQQKAAEKVKEEIRRAEKRLKELSNQDLPSATVEGALEVESIEPETTHVPEGVVLPETKAFAAASHETSTTELPSFSFEEAPKRLMGIKTPLIGAGVGLVILAGLGAWFSVNSGGAAPSVQSTQTSLSSQLANIETNTVSVPAQLPAVDVQSVAVAPSPSPEQSANTAAVPNESSSLPNDQPSTQIDRPKQSPTAKKPVSAKTSSPKKVTADDLINDN